MLYVQILLKLYPGAREEGSGRAEGARVEYHSESWQLHYFTQWRKQDTDLHTAVCLLREGKWCKLACQRRTRAVPNSVSGYAVWLAYFYPLCLQEGWLTWLAAWQQTAYNSPRLFTCRRLSHTFQSTKPPMFSLPRSVPWARAMAWSSSKFSIGEMELGLAAGMLAGISACLSSCLHGKTEFFT